MEKFNKIFFYLTIFVLISISAFGQNEKVSESEDNKSSKRSYIEVTGGIAYSSFRDKATSPLIYQGNPLHFGLSQIDINDKHESSIQASYSFGIFSSRSLNSEITSNVKAVNVNYHELFKISSWSSSKRNIKIGGKLLSTVNFRENSTFGNNSKGFEVISNLCASIKGTQSFEFKKKHIKNSLCAIINIGLINAVYRNGFIYTSQSPLLNEENIYGGYQLSVFSGFRVNSELTYTLWLKNDNGLKLAYQWDFYGTGNQTNGFFMASHFLNLSLLFNLK